MKPSPQNGTKLYDLPTGQAAALIGVSLTTLRRWADDGRVSYRKTITGRRRFNRAEVLTLVESHTGEFNPDDAA